MTAEEIIRSGLVESYCLGFVSAEEKLMIETVAANSSLLATEIESQRKYFNDGLLKRELQPSAKVKIAVMQRVYRMQALTDRKFLPLINEQTNWEELLQSVAANGISERDESLSGIPMWELPSTPEVSNFIVWSSGKNEPEIHHDVQEFIVILKGSCNMYVDGEMKSYTAGDMVKIPLHKTHYAEVTSIEPMCALVQRQRIA